MLLHLLPSYTPVILLIYHSHSTYMAMGDGWRVTVIYEENNMSITVKEGQDALINTKTGKAPGIDGCHVECMMKGGESDCGVVGEAV